MLRESHNLVLVVFPGVVDRHTEEINLFSKRLVDALRIHKAFFHSPYKAVILKFSLVLASLPSRTTECPTAMYLRYVYTYKTT